MLVCKTSLLGEIAWTIASPMTAVPTPERAAGRRTPA